MDWREPPTRSRGPGPGQDVTCIDQQTRGVDTKEQGVAKRKDDQMAWRAGGPRGGDRRALTGSSLWALVGLSPAGTLE